MFWAPTHDRGHLGLMYDEDLHHLPDLKWPAKAGAPDGECAGDAGGGLPPAILREPSDDWQTVSTADPPPG